MLKTSFAAYFMVFWCFTSVLMNAQPLFAAQLQDPSTQFEDVEDASENLTSDLTDDEWESNKDADLTEDQGERRERAEKALLLNAGEGALWTSLGVRGMRWTNDYHAGSVHLGVGRFHEMSESGVHDLKSSSLGLGLRSQWWLAKHFPLAVFVDVGVHRWLIQANCVAGGTEAVCSEGKWKGQGGSVGTGLLLSWLAAERMMLEWNLVSIHRTGIFKATWSGGSGGSPEEQARLYVSNKKLIGITNLTVGMYF